MTYLTRHIYVGYNSGDGNFGEGIFSKSPQITHPKLNQGIFSEVSVDLRLSVLNSKHATWIIEIFEKFQSDKGATIIKKLV